MYERPYSLDGQDKHVAHLSLIATKAVEETSELKFKTYEKAKAYNMYGWSRLQERSLPTCMTMRQASRLLSPPFQRAQSLGETGGSLQAKKAQTQENGCVRYGGKWLTCVLGG